MAMYPDEVALPGYREKSAAADQASVSQEACAGTELDFEQLFQRFHGMVFQLGYRVLGDREEALDLAQEVFLIVFRRMDRFRGESSLKTWIYRITVNLAANRCRWWNRLRRRGTVSLDAHLSRTDERDLCDTLEDVGDSPELSLLHKEERERIESSILQLPVLQRIAVVMRDIEGLSYEEIAEATQASLGTVKSRIARGREELKHRLNGVLG
jgi:RNA polymerase sigma-70 factor (ECF subfamily)